MERASAIGDVRGSLPRAAFKSPPQVPPGGGAAPRPTRDPGVMDQDPRAIRCRYCRQDITAPSYRTAVQGAHGHTFANPLGVVFEVVCYSQVRGLGYTGPETDEFTWFPGYRWRVALCGRCQVHLGWRFSAGRDDDFHALILDRLLFPDPNR
jgi:hypothetical protein